jgi:DNA integrity scanning protein DisA with diadenylate cyclase activity
MSALIFDETELTAKVKELSRQVWLDAQEFVAEMADEAAEKMESGEFPRHDGVVTLRWFAMMIRALGDDLPEHLAAKALH